jgi:hypothetical protein
MGLIAIFHRPDIDLVIVSVRSHPFDKYDLMPIVDGDNEPVIVAFDIEDDSVLSDDACIRIVSQNVCRAFPASPEHFVKPRVESRLDGLLVFVAPETVNELP